MAFISTQLSDLPDPGPEAEVHGQKVMQSLHQMIRDAGGFIGFDQYMQQVLYAPGLGYYSAGSEKFGSQGDFVTAPLLTPLFNQTLGQYVLSNMPEGGSILELGAGSGIMAADILTFLQDKQRLPEQYQILETSGELQARQQQTLQHQVPHLLDRVVWLDQLDNAENFSGIVLGNEVLDAIPVKRFAIENGDIHELGVGLCGKDLCWKTRDADTDFHRQVEGLLPAAISSYPDGYSSEISLLIGGWIQALSSYMAEGIILLLDYGHERSAYYATDRVNGTLRGYYRHYAVDDAFFQPGLMDLTAWVDFTTVAEASLSTDLSVAGYSSQANFLIDNGLLSLAETAIDYESGGGISAEYLSQAESIKRLLEPGEMGETVKAIALSKNTEPASYFSRDQRYRL